MHRKAAHYATTIPPLFLPPTSLNSKLNVRIDTQYADEIVWVNGISIKIHSKAFHTIAANWIYMQTRLFHLIKIHYLLVGLGTGGVMMENWFSISCAACERGKRGQSKWKNECGGEVVKLFCAAMVKRKKFRIELDAIWSRSVRVDDK